MSPHTPASSLISRAKLKFWKYTCTEDKPEKWQKKYPKQGKTEPGEQTAASFHPLLWICYCPLGKHRRNINLAPRQRYQANQIQVVIQWLLLQLLFLLYLVLTRAAQPICVDSDIFGRGYLLLIYAFITFFFFCTFITVYAWKFKDFPQQIKYDISL